MICLRSDKVVKYWFKKNSFLFLISLQCFLFANFNKYFPCVTFNFQNFKNSSKKSLFTKRKIRILKFTFTFTGQIYDVIHLYSTNSFSMLLLANGLNMGF